MCVCGGGGAFDVPSSCLFGVFGSWFCGFWIPHVDDFSPDTMNFSPWVCRCVFCVCVLCVCVFVCMCVFCGFVVVCVCVCVCVLCLCLDQELQSTCKIMFSG